MNLSSRNLHSIVWIFVKKVTPGLHVLRKRNQVIKKNINYMIKLSFLVIPSLAASSPIPSIARSSSLCLLNNSCKRRLCIKRHIRASFSSPIFFLCEWFCSVDINGITCGKIMLLSVLCTVGCNLMSFLFIHHKISATDTGFCNHSQTNNHFCCSDREGRTKILNWGTLFFFFCCCVYLHY